MPKSKSGRKIYYNQESFIIDKKIDKANKRWMEIEKDALWNAFHDMTPTELVFYLYIMSNCDGVDWAFSMADAVEKTGYTERAIRTAKHGLKKKGYWNDDEQIFHQYRESENGKFFPDGDEYFSEDYGNFYRTNKIKNKINDNRDTPSANRGSILESPEEEETVSYASEHEWKYKF